MRAASFAAEDVEMLMLRYGAVRGVRQLRDLLPLIDAGAESPKESWLRLLLIDGGLPAPETQIPILEDGVPVAFLDMGYRDIKLAAEYDGDQHRSDRRQYVRDVRTSANGRRHGWEVIRVITEDRPADVLWRAKEAFLRRGGAEIDEMSAIYSHFRCVMSVWAQKSQARRGAASRSRRSCSTSVSPSGSSGPTTRDSSRSASSGLRARHGPCR